MRYEKTEQVLENRMAREREVRDAKLLLWVEYLRGEDNMDVLSRFGGLKTTGHKHVNVLKQEEVSMQKQLQQV